jgi:hypothetical protein
MNLVFAILIILATSGIAITALLLVRRRAPDGGYFHDGDRAAGVFGTLATGFAVLLGLIVFLAFASYDQSRAGAETEALTVIHQIETAQFLAPEATRELTGELTCYARYVIHQEWPRMESGDLNDSVSPWGIELFLTMKDVQPDGPVQETAFDTWLDQTSAREDARLDRVHGAEGILPWPLWLVLFFSAGIIFVFMLFFADSGERAVVQALQIGSVVAVITATLLVIRLLENPFQSGSAGLKPVAMERTLRILEEELAGVGQQGTPPCTERGEPL